MIVGRMLAWLATVVTAGVVGAWLLVSLLMAGGPGAEVLQLVAPDRAPLEERIPGLPAPGSADEDAVEDAAGDGAEDGAQDAAEDAAEDGDPASDGAAPDARSPNEVAPNEVAPNEVAPNEVAPNEVADGASDGETGAGRDSGSDPDSDSDSDPATEEEADGNGDEDGAGDEDENGAVAPSVNWPDFEAYDEVLTTQPVIQTTHFDLYAVDEGDPVLAASVARWAGQIETLHDYVTSRAGPLAQEPVRVLFDRRYEARCPARGLASPGGETPYLVVFVDESTTDRQVRAVLAHEIAHHVFAGEDFVGDGVLTEGLANWAAGDYALDWQGFESWDEAARGYLEAGTYVSVADDGALTPREGEDCIVRRDRIYNVRAAFVTWLIERYGLDLVRAMPARTEQRLNALAGERQEMRVPDYEAATGRTLTQLESAWLRELRGGAPEPALEEAPDANDVAPANVAGEGGAQAPESAEDQP